MNKPDEKIEKAVAAVRKNMSAKIVRHFEGFIVLAQSEVDYQIKVMKIRNNDTKGFFKVEEVYRGLSIE